MKKLAARDFEDISGTFTTNEVILRQLAHELQYIIPVVDGLLPKRMRRMSPTSFSSSVLGTPVPSSGFIQIIH